MSDKDFKPASNDSAKQHFADAALDEFARLGTKEDATFLAKMDNALNEVDFQTDLHGSEIIEMPRPGSRRTLWISGAAAAIIVVGLVPVFNFLKLETHRANSPQIVASVTQKESNVSMYGQDLVKSPQSTGPVSPHVLVPQTGPAAKAESNEELPESTSLSSILLAEDGQHTKSEVMIDVTYDDRDSLVAQRSDAQVSVGYDTDYVFKGTKNGQPTPSSRGGKNPDTTYIDGKDLITSVTEKPTGTLNFGAGSSSIDVTGFAEITKSNTELSRKTEQIGHGGYSTVRGFNQSTISGSTRDESRLTAGHEAKEAAPVSPEAETPGFSFSGLDKAPAKNPSLSLAVDTSTGIPIAVGRTPTLTPYIGYNGTPDGWIADGNGGSSGSNANDVLHGGVSLSVDFDGPSAPAAATRSKARLLAKTTDASEAIHPAARPAAGKPQTKSPAPERERYGELVDNAFQSPLNAPLSTFSVDVDTASYSNIRRMVNDNIMIPADSVRIEEMINYFSYNYPQPKGEHPFAFAVETADCPWNGDHQLMRVGIQGKSMDRDKRPAANLVFLLDVSGSMSPTNKLPLVKQSMSLMIEELTEKDTVSVVVYAGAEGLCLPPTSGDQKEKILGSLNKLQSGGSTNGGAGIQLAYKLAKDNFKPDGINRVILCTDGDFNVGRTDEGGLVTMVEKKAKDGTFLSVLGFGSGNINDSMMEAITNKGNGNYFYIDSLKEGRKVLLQDLMSTLVTIAKDVKIQIEFNPKHVQNYRLIGYANRMLKAEDFENDKVDAGEIGAGHAVTALYEIVPAGAPPIERQMSNLKYQQPVEPELPKMKLVESDELCTLKLRYKLPKSDKSIPMEEPVTYKSREWKEASDDYQFAAAAALWGMLLREGEYCGAGTIEDVLEMAKEGKGADPFGRRNEFIGLVNKWSATPKLSGKPLNHDDAMHGGVRIGVEF